MIKRILVALDTDTDSTVAVSYAATIAERTDAVVTALALVDTESIASHSKGGGIGSMHYAEKARAKLTEDTRKIAERLVREFDAQMAERGVSAAHHIKEGVPAEEIVAEARFHDVLLMGRSPHYFYGHPDQETKTLERIIYESMTPTLVVHEDHRPVERVLIAYDGSRPASKALHGFVQLRPFGKGTDVELLHVTNEEAEASELMLREAKRYLEAHGFAARTASRTGGDPHAVILSHAEHMNADLLVVGTHAVSKMRKMAFGSTTAQLVKNATLPLFLDN